MPPGDVPAGSFSKRKMNHGIDENARQRRFDSMLEAAGVLPLLVKAEQCLEIGIADRTPERLRGERRQNLFGAGSFVI